MRYLSRLEFYFDYDQEEESFVSFVFDVLRRRGGKCKILDIRDFYLTPRVFVQESLVTLK